MAYVVDAEDETPLPSFTHPRSATLLDELIAGATGDDVPVATLLRKVKVLASRVGVPTLAEWVDHELTGYPADAQVPNYRGPFPTEVSGNFGGPGGSSLRDVPIGSLSFPEEARSGGLFSAVFRQPIVEIERSSTEKGLLHNNWPANAVGRTNGLIDAGEIELYPGMYLHQAWQTFSPNIFLSAVDAVRTRILDLALSLERIAPLAGEPGSPSVDRSGVEQIVQTIVFGNLMVGSNTVVNVSMPPAGDLDALLRFLSDQGLESEQLTELKEALTEDESESADPPKGFGPRVTDWLQRAGAGGAVAAGKGAATAIGGLAAKAVASYLGLPF